MDWVPVALKVGRFPPLVAPILLAVVMGRLLLVATVLSADDKETSSIDWLNPWVRVANLTLKNLRLDRRS